MSEAALRVPWVRWWYGDFLADVGHLGAAETGVYVLMLLHYYQSGKPLARDLERVCRICRATEPETRRAVEYVLSEYWVAADDPEYGPVWRHLRAERELDWAHQRHRETVERARKGGLAKSRKRRAKADSCGAADTVDVPQAEHKQSTSTQQEVLDECLTPANQKKEPISFGDRTAPPSRAQAEDETASNPREVIWSLGVRLLTEQGGKPAAVRSFLGKLAQLHGEAALAQGVLAMQAEGPAEARAWLAAWLMNREGNHGAARGRRRTRGDDNIAWYNEGFDQLVRQISGGSGV